MSQSFRVYFLSVLALLLLLGCAHQAATKIRIQPSTEADVPYGDRPDLRRSYLEGYVDGEKEVLKHAADLKDLGYDDFGVRTDLQKAWVQGYYEGWRDAAKAVTSIHKYYQNIFLPLLKKSEDSN